MSRSLQEPPKERVRLRVVSLASLLAARPSLQPFPGWILGCKQEGGDWLSKLRRRVWARAKRPFVIPWFEGMQVWVSTSDELLKSLFMTGCFEPNEFLFLDRLLRPGMTVVDVGANLGLYTLFAAGKVGKKGTVLSLEPSTREFQKLRANVDLNQLTQVRLLQMGASNHPREADMLIADEVRSGHNTLGAFCYDTKLDRKETVSLERLDEIVRSQAISCVDVLKIDIEGGELFALQGGAQTLNTFRPILLLEFSDPSAKAQGSSSAQVWNFLSGLGYRFYAFDEKTGLPLPASLKPAYLGENLIAVHPAREDEWSRIMS
jgi:FkbM family methyltransferase